MLDVLVLILIGVVLGFLTGLIPGIHPNLLAAVFVTLAFEPFSAVVILVAAAVTNTFVSFVPAIFLGAPEAGTEISVLPGHSLLLEGRGYEAVRLAVTGGIVTVAVALLTLPLASVFLPSAYGLVRPYLHLILSFVLLYAVWTDRSIWTVVVVVLSGTLGVLALDYFREPLFPMLTGLFGLSGLLYSMKTPSLIPSQTLLFEKVQKLSGATLGYVTGMLVGILPGIGMSQGVFLLQQGLKQDTQARAFLIAIGGVAIADTMFSLLALWLIGNPRSGVAVAVGELLGDIDAAVVIALLGVICISSAVALAITLKTSALLANRLNRIDYGKLTVVVAAGLVVLVLLLAGLEGLALLILSTAIGLVTISSGAKRSYCMSALLVPTILFFAGF